MFRPSRRDRAASEKREVLSKLIDAEGEACSNAIIFCNRKTDVDTVAKSLKKNGYDTAPIHGDLEQSQRTKTLDGFREGTIRFLVASDVAARGLDIPLVSHVFNYDVPTHSEDYVHRIGRTGRAGREGKAIMISTPSDEKNLDAIERLLGKEIPRNESPLGQAPDQPVPAEPDTEEKPKRSRTRSRKPKEAPAKEQPAEQVQAETADEAPNKTANEDTRPTPRSRGRAGRGRGRDEDNVVGMGDHLPSFIEKSFEERLAS